ncbi:MAG: hypothetical protein KBF37_02715 [Saprospiraceae bacterium]|nr:hypothetical protein [Saprospiraceae bacterium]MBP9209211.1 hypothetical protein [Saprospiraceae bacterium]
MSFSELFRVVARHLRTLVLTGMVAAAASVALALLLPVYYKATTVIFPVKLGQTPVNETSFRRGNISDFGETGEAEQALEILNSTTLMDRVIEQHDLFAHFKIKRDLPIAHTLARKTFQGNVDIKRTKFNSIQITVLDKHPAMAANIANSIANYLDTIKYEMVRNRAHELIANLERQHLKQQNLIDSLKSALDSMAGQGIMSQFQRAYLIDAFGQSSGNERKELRQLVDANIRWGEEFDKLERIYEREIENLMLINKYLVQTKADAEIQFSQKFVVDAAEPAEKKSYPIRWLVVLVGVASAMLLAVSWLLLRQKWPEFSARFLNG